MGQSCGCADSSQEDKLKELEKLLAQQKDEISKLESNYIKISKQSKAIQENNVNDSTKLKKQIQQLESEKKNTIKEMMKEKKKISKLQETKEKLENKKRNMEKQIIEYKKQISRIESSTSSATKSHNNYFEEESTDIKSPSMSPSPSPYPSNYNIQTDMDEIHQWLVTKSGDKKQDNKFFNKKMTELLTRRPKTHSLEIMSAWNDKYGKTLLDQIEYKLSGKTRGIPYRILAGLLQSESEIDCRFIQECMYNNMQIDKIAGVICARTVGEIIEIKKFWKKEYGNDIRVMLDKCANQYKKNTMLHLFKNLCNTDQRERNDKMQTKEKVNLVEINKHVEWMVNTNKYKHAEKEKMCKLVTINSNDYVKILVGQYKNKSKNNESIEGYIDRKYGMKSMVGMHLKNHIKFVENKSLYFADRIRDLAGSKDKFKENNLEILNIFLGRFQVDLNEISVQFANANNGKSLRHFIKEKGSNHSSLYFLMKILEYSKRY